MNAMTQSSKIYSNGNVFISLEERNNMNRGKFRRLSRQVSGEVFDVPEDNGVLFLYKKEYVNQVLIGEISFSHCNTALNEPGYAFDSEFYPLITFLFIHRDFQGCGYGLLLVREVLKLIKSKNACRPVRLQSAEDSMGFFEKCGFRACGEPIECFHYGPRLFRTLVNMEYKWP